jgi:flagellar biosynthesis component FlhA
MPQPLMLAGGVLLAMAAFPGLPKLPFSCWAWDWGQWRGA